MFFLAQTIICGIFLVISLVVVGMCAQNLEADPNWNKITWKSIQALAWGILFIINLIALVK
jgi:hypothetical protein